MSWEYVLRTQERTPPCPYCRSLGGVVRVVSTLYVCLDCGGNTARRVFEAVWRDDASAPNALPAGTEAVGRAGGPAGLPTAVPSAEPSRSAPPPALAVGGSAPHPRRGRVAS